MKEKEFIENVLKVMKFDTNNINSDSVQFINMCEYGVSSKEKPLLLTCNLQTCIALVAYEKNFSFLAHMNVYKGNWTKDFELDNEGMPTRCKKVDDLHNEMLKDRSKISDTVNIGLVLGVAPLEKDYKSRQIIEKDLLALFQNLRKNNIPSVRLPDINSFSFILDSTTGNIMHDGAENSNRITSIRDMLPNTNKEKTDVKEK